MYGSSRGLKMFKRLMDKVKSYFVKEAPILTDAEIKDLKNGKWKSMVWCRYKTNGN